MWKLVFNTITNRGVAANRDPLDGEFSKDLPPSECAWFMSEPDRYVWNGTGIEEDSTYADRQLVKAKASVWEKIKIERDTRKDGGFKVNGWWFHSDQPSRVQHLGLVMLGASLPSSIMWKTMSGEFVPLTPAVVSQIFASGLQLDTALFTQAEIHRAAMELSSDPEAYDYSTGWPENFLGL